MSNTPDPQFNPFATPGVAVAPSGIASTSLPLQRYSLVRIGLQMVYYSIAAMFLMLILIVAVSLFGFSMLRAGPGGGPPPGLGLMGLGMGLGVLGVIAAFITMLVGFCLCIATPNSNEKPLAIISVVCFFLSFGLGFVGGIFDGPGTETMSAIFTMVGNISSCASSVVFCMFLKRVGQNITSEVLRKSAHSALIWISLTFVVAIFGGGLLAILGGTGAFSINRNSEDLLAIIGIPFGLAMIVLGLGTLFSYLAMLRTGINELKPRSYG